MSMPKWEDEGYCIRVNVEHLTGDAAELIKYHPRKRSAYGARIAKVIANCPDARNPPETYFKMYTQRHGDSQHRGGWDGLANFLIENMRFEEVQDNNPPNANRPLMLKAYVIPEHKLESKNSTTGKKTTWSLVSWIIRREDITVKDKDGKDVPIKDAFVDYMVWENQASLVQIESGWTWA